MTTTSSDTFIPPATLDTAAGIDQAPSARVHHLQAELTEIVVDREMARRMQPATTSRWLAELAREERDCRSRLHEAAIGTRTR